MLREITIISILFICRLFVMCLIAVCFSVLQFKDSAVCVHFSFVSSIWLLGGLL